MPVSATVCPGLTEDLTHQTMTGPMLGPHQAGLACWHISKLVLVAASPPLEAHVVPRKQKQQQHEWTTIY